MKFGLRLALLAQTKCQDLSPRASRVTPRFSAATDTVSYDYASEDCTVVFDSEGAYCMEEAALMSRMKVEECVLDSANPEKDCAVPPKYQGLMDRIIQKKAKPRSPGPPQVTVVDSEGSFEEAWSI